jgi:WD40 repeat protein
VSEGDHDPYQLPITHEVTLQGHDRAVTCLDIEHSGNRLISGSMDYTLRIFDFNGMKADLRSFR